MKEYLKFDSESEFEDKNDLPVDTIQKIIELLESAKESTKIALPRI